MSAPGRSQALKPAVRSTEGNPRPAPGRSQALKPAVRSTEGNPGQAQSCLLVAPTSRAHGDLCAIDVEFINLQNAYRPHGGLRRLLSPGMRDDWGMRPNDTEMATLAREGKVFGFGWNHALWIPLFQLQMPGTVECTASQRVVAELGCAFDGWALARWFVQPNQWLDGARPVQCLDSRLPDVLQAARAERFVVNG